MIAIKLIVALNMLTMLKFRLPEKAFWVFVVILFAIFSALIIRTAVLDWTDDPAITRIDTFSKVWGAQALN